MGGISNLCGQAVVVLSLLAIVPVVLNHVGAASYGVWVLIGSIGSFGFLLDFGLSAAVISNVARHAAVGEREEISRLVASVTLVYLAVAFGLAIGGVVLWLTLPLIMRGSGPVARLAPPLSALVGADIAVSLLGIPAMALLRGLQRFPILNAVNAFWAVIGALLTLVALVSGGGILAVAGLGALNSLLTTVHYVLLARRQDPRFVGRPRRDGRTIRRLLEFSRSVWMIQLAGVLQGRLDAVVVGAALPVHLLAPYNFAQRLSSGAEIITDQFSKVLLPYASEVAADDERSSRRVFLTATRLSLILAVGTAIPLALLGGPILRLWAGAGFGAHGDIVALLVLAAVVDLASHPCAAVLQSINRHGPIARMAIGGGITNIMISIALVGPMGIRGVALATLVATVGEIALFVIPYGMRVLGVTAAEFGREVILPLVAPGVLLTGLIVGGRALMPGGSLSPLILVVAGGVLGYGLAYATVGAPPEERAIYAGILRSARRWPLRLLPFRERRGR